MSTDPFAWKRRGLEIELWIRRNFPHSDFKDLKIAIVDDNSDMHTLKGRLVQTKYEHGLTQEHAESLIEKLKTPIGDILAHTNDWYLDNAFDIKKEQK